MENNNNNSKTKKRRTRNNKKNKNKNQKPVNGVQNKSPKENVQKNEFMVSTTTKVVTSSPRPSNLQTHTKTTTTNYKRNSGSEYEEFQTPSVEYDIKNESFDDVKDRDISYEYDKEWEEIGSFKSANLDEIVEHEQITRNEMLSNCDTESTNGTSAFESICLIRSDPVEYKTVFTNNGFQEIHSLENEIIFSSNGLQDEVPLENEIIFTSNGLQDEVTLDNEIIITNNGLQDEVSLENEIIITNNGLQDDVLLENEIIITSNSLYDEDQPSDLPEKVITFTNNALEDMEEQLCDVVDEESIDTEKYQMVVNKFFDDIDYEYCSNQVEDLVQEINDDVSTECDSDVLKFEVEEETKIDNKNVNEEISITMPWTENVEETLNVCLIKLDVTHEPFVQKSMTLRPRASENSFNLSATSITNVSSISNDNIPRSIDNDLKLSKKHKSNTFNIYKSLLRKFKKSKTPEKESPKKELSEHNLTLKSEDFVKDSEIESNQSLKSDVDCNSQIFPQTEDSENNRTQDKINTDITMEEKTEPTNVKKNEVTKSEKSKLFNNIIKRKPKHSKPEVELKIGDTIASEKSNVDIIPSKIEIDKEVLDEFDEAVKSLKCSEPETRYYECVTGNQDVHTSMEIVNDHIFEPCLAPFEDEEEDYLFPDAITATKILGVKPVDVPYIDDPAVSKRDYIMLYNGESKRLRISTEFFVPKASMETLYFPGESMSKDVTKKSLQCHSPTRRKRGFGSILGCMTRGR